MSDNKFGDVVNLFGKTGPQDEISWRRLARENEKRTTEVKLQYTFQDIFTNLQSGEEDLIYQQINLLEQFLQEQSFVDFISEFRIRLIYQLTAISQNQRYSATTRSASKELISTINQLKK